MGKKVVLVSLRKRGDDFEIIATRNMFRRCSRRNSCARFIGIKKVVLESLFVSAQTGEDTETTLRFLQVFWGELL